ncbi:hypothetical protein DFH06DRAFT_1150335 [Mycena polygramma]|nr:hypothetical protein DFH06DRAFT_1150335 [Mycena polygramma]
MYVPGYEPPPSLHSFLPYHHHPLPFVPPPPPNSAIAVNFCAETTYRRPASGHSTLPVFQKILAAGRHAASRAAIRRVPLPSAVVGVVSVPRRRRAAAPTSALYLGFPRAAFRARQVRSPPAMRRTPIPSAVVVVSVEAQRSGADVDVDTIFGLPASGIFLHANPRLHLQYGVTDIGARVA